VFGVGQEGSVWCETGGECLVWDSGTGGWGVQLTAVATRIGVRPVLKLCRAASLSPWERSPWIQVVW